ncbi:hypothetical protein HK098_001238 [Nowakowskiella sp. JEL0407]|nr:hypothetical protein HK098_001238 [Nowakowskiella sp. JEL0407]
MSWNSPDLFVPILEFYRTGIVRLLPGMSKAALMQELDYFGIDVSIVSDIEHGLLYQGIPSSSSPSSLTSLQPKSTSLEILASRFIPIIIECLRSKISNLSLQIDLQGRLSAAKLSKHRNNLPKKRPSSYLPVRSSQRVPGSNGRRASSSNIVDTLASTSLSPSPPSSKKSPPVTLASVSRRDLLFWEDFISLFYSKYRDNFDSFVHDFLTHLTAQWINSIHFVDATEWAAEDGLASKVRFSGGSGFKDPADHNSPVEIIVREVITKDDEGLPLIANPAASGRQVSGGSSGELDGILPPQNLLGVQRVGFLQYHCGWEIILVLREPFAKSRDESGVYWFYEPA